MGKAPVFFLSHGAPTFALEPGALGERLRELGRQLGEVAAVLVLSPHWQTPDLRVMSTAAPATVHDFGGFPSALYALEYPASGHPQLAAETGRVLTAAGYQPVFDAQRGLDHGAWVPLMHLLPQAQLPVFQVSMPYALDSVSAYQLGEALAPLRESGVAIVGAGGMTHNLADYRPSSANVADYALEFTRWVRQSVTGRNARSLLDYRELAPHARRAHPSEEHFLPLLIALGAAEDDVAQLIDGGIRHGALSMDSYAWGLADPNGMTRIH